MTTSRVLLLTLTLACPELPSTAAAQTFITAWGSPGTGEGQFNTPQGIAVDADGYIYVVDRNNWRIQELGFAPAPVHGLVWGGLKNRCRGADARRLP